MWKITKFEVKDGIPYGDPITSICYTQELMESYKNPKFVVKIEEIVGKNKLELVWSNRKYDSNR